MSTDAGIVDMRAARLYIRRMNVPDRSEQDLAGGPTGIGWSIERVLRNDVASLVSATAELEARLSAAAVPSEAVYSCSLALEEVFTNIVRHAYSDEGAHEVRFEVCLTGDHVVLRFADDGRAFDPLAASAPDLARPPEDRPIGGLGIHHVRKLADRLEYERAGGLNRLTVHIPLRAKE